MIVPLREIPRIEELHTQRQENAIQTAPQGLFAQTLQGAMESLEEAQKLARQDAYDLAVGDVADLHDITIHSAMQQTAVETVVQLTSRAVSAYKEIMQIQV